MQATHLKCFRQLRGSCLLHLGHLLGSRLLRGSQLAAMCSRGRAQLEVLLLQHHCLCLKHGQALQCSRQPQVLLLEGMLAGADALQLRDQLPVLCARACQLGMHLGQRLLKDSALHA